METDGITSECNRITVPVQNKDVQDQGLAMDTDTLPDVLLGSEAWHTTLPSVSCYLLLGNKPLLYMATLFLVPAAL